MGCSPVVSRIPRIPGFLGFQGFFSRILGISQDFKGFPGFSLRCGQDRKNPGGQGLLEEVCKLLFLLPDLDVKFRVCGLRNLSLPETGGESAYCPIIGRYRGLVWNGSDLVARVFCLTDIHEEMIHG